MQNNKKTKLFEAIPKTKKQYNLQYSNYLFLGQVKDKLF